jgi:hypothetical protein
VSRSRSWIAIVAIIIVVATALAAAAVPQKAEAASLKGKLRIAKLALRHSNYRLKAAEAALTAVAVDPTLTITDPAATPAPAATAAATAPTVEELKARVVRMRRVVRMWERRVRTLAEQFRLERKMAMWERRGKWMPIIEMAAAKYHVKADGMYRMMMRESGGQRCAGANGAYKGLFQYWTGTWSASWNPWRHDSIYDGSSQIYATAYAISKGMGPQMWTTTWASQY